MTSFVFDTGALSLLYASDKLRPVTDSISSGNSLGIVSAVTLAEFYYKTCHILGRSVADVWSRQVSEKMRVDIVDLEIASAAGLEKCRNNNLSLADCFALALTRKVHGTLLTTDSELAKDKQATVRFLSV